MAGLLDGDLAKSIYRGFRGKLRAGVIRRALVPAGSELDAHGDPVALAPQLTALEGFAEGYSRFTRAQAGIPETDVKLSIFAASMPGIVPAIGNQVRLDRRDAGRVSSIWYQIKGPVDIDPAGVLYECQSFVIAEPTNGG